MNIRGDVSAECTVASYNMDYLIGKYDEVKRGSEKYALLLINIKNFRYFNTKYGVAGGNEILQMVLEALMKVLEEDEYGARLYGDNFAALLRYEDADTLVNERIMDLIDKLYRIDDDRIYRNIFCSMGIYEITDKDVSFQDALNYANLSRKESKGLLNRSVCLELYHKSFYDNYMSRMELETDTANAYKEYEFTTYLQPKVDLKNQCMSGAEALLRWFDKDGNPIPLHIFLPILNQNSYIILIDLDTFDQMCRYLDTRIKNKQSVVPISFNISKSHFYNPSVLEDYIRIFEKYDIPKHLVEIEFMESISLDDTEHMKKIISGFKEYGFTCVLDDFGNGYSSFNVLLNANLDTVKMDRQFFVNNLNGDARLIIKTVLDLLHSLNVEVVAEGVELEEHVEYLKACGCDYVQGFYYYKPMPVEAFGELLDLQGEKEEE